MRNGFDNDLYLKKQSEHIRKRIESSGEKLYLEFGGKLFDDYHAARVLPGFDVNAKVKLLQKLADTAEIIFVINASDIEHHKIRADFGITYDMDVLRLIDNLRGLGIQINSVVITQYEGQHAADVFKNKLELRGEKVYIHRLTKGYPTDVNTIVSDEGYGANPYIETTRPLVVVTAPGPGSGKLATCLSQLYHEFKRGVKAGYAKFETFPIWNIPLKHPVNLAYEAATADLRDVNMIDPFHLEAYGITSVNYNRDVEVFPVVNTILSRIMGKEVYRSPTDMGVNMAGYCIYDDDAVREASYQEIIRRYYHALVDYKSGNADVGTAQRVELIMNECGISRDQRKVVKAALDKSAEAGTPATAIELPNGKIVTGKSTELMDSCAGAVVNSLKELAGIPDEMKLIAPIIIEPILRIKGETLAYKTSKLNLEEVLIALSICAATNPVAEHALSKLKLLSGCEIHCSHMLTGADEDVFRRLRVNVTCEPEYPTKDLFYV